MSLPGNPYANLHGGENDAKSQAWESFYRTFGRAPTALEEAKIYGAFRGTDPNITDLGTGNALVAQLYESSPEYQQKQYQDQQAKYLESGKAKYGDVSSLFQSMLGRDATEAEKQHFGSLLASGQLDLYQLNQFMQQLPEYANTQDAKMRADLSSTMQGQDERYYNEKILPAIQSQMAKQGRSLESSGFASALAQAAKEQNTNRESFLNQLTASQYGNNKAAANTDYQKLVDNWYNNQNYNRSRTDQLSDYNTNRINEIQNYQIQKNAYDDYLKNYGKRKYDWMDYTNLGITAALAGTSMYKNISQGYNAGKDTTTGSQG